MSWICEDSFCTPLFIHEMRKVFKRAKLLADTYPGIKVATHIMAPCGFLYCVRSGSAELDAHHRGPKLGISRRLRQIVKDSKCMLDLFPRCRISIKARAVAHNAPFDFSYTNFQPHESAALGIGPEQPTPEPNPVAPTLAETVPDASQEDSAALEEPTSSPTMLMRFGKDARVRRKGQWWLGAAPHDVQRKAEKSISSEQPPSPLKSLMAENEDFSADDVSAFSGDHFRGGQLPGVHQLMDALPRPDLSPDALSDVSTTSALSDEPAVPEERWSIPPRPSATSISKNRRKKEPKVRGKASAPLPAVRSLMPLEHVDLLLGLRSS